MNLLVGTEQGLLLLDRSGRGRVYGLVSRRRFQQIDVLEGLNLLTTISGETPAASCDLPSTPNLLSTTAVLRPSAPAPPQLSSPRREAQQAARVLPVLAAQQGAAQ